MGGCSGAHPRQRQAEDGGELAQVACRVDGALALRALPTNLPNTLRDAHSLASLLLDTCGEDAKVPLLPHAVDPHVKMMSIGAIYGAAELHMLTDSSPGLNDTWTFLEREVDALRTMASTTNRMPDISPAALLVNLLMRK